MVKSRSGSEKALGFLDRTSMYGFELFMALFGLVTTLIVIDYGIFALFNYFMGFEGSNSFFSEFTIWIISAMIVWLPVTLTFYLRSRSDTERNKDYSSTTLYKVLMSIYHFFVITGAALLAFIAIYTLIRTSVTPDEPFVDMLVRVVLPALVAVLVHIGLMFAYTKSGRPSKSMFAGIFGGASLALIVTLLVVSIGVLRGVKQDEITSGDLSRIQSAIADYQYTKKDTPGDLSQLSLLNKDTKARLSKYDYKRVDDQRYELCAEFNTSTKNSSRYDPMPVGPVDEEGEYHTYASVYSHDKGRVCYKLRTSSKYYDKSVIEQPDVVY